MLNVEGQVIQCKVKQNNGEAKVNKSAQNHLRGTIRLRVRLVLLYDGCHEAGFLVQGRIIQIILNEGSKDNPNIILDMLCERTGVN